MIYIDEASEIIEFDGGHFRRSWYFCARSSLWQTQLIFFVRAHPTSYPMGTRGFFPGVKAAGA
jgi:hypothetical protein